MQSAEQIHVIRDDIAVALGRLGEDPTPSRVEEIAARIPERMHLGAATGGLSRWDLLLRAVQKVQDLHGQPVVPALKAGDRFTLKTEELDDDDGHSRVTPAGSVWVVNEVELVQDGTIQYSVTCPETGAWIFLEGGELAKCGYAPAQAVASSGASAPVDMLSEVTAGANEVHATLPGVWTEEHGPGVFYRFYNDRNAWLEARLDGADVRITSKCYGVLGGVIRAVMQVGEARAAAADRPATEQAITDLETKLAEYIHSHSRSADAAADIEP